MNQSESAPRRRLVREEFVGDPGPILEQMNAYDRDWKLLLRERERILRERPETWVACAEGSFYFAEDMFDLFRLLKDQGLDPRKYPSEFISNKKLLLIYRWR